MKPASSQSDNIQPWSVRNTSPREPQRRREGESSAAQLGGDPDFKK